MLRRNVRGDFTFYTGRGAKEKEEKRELAAAVRASWETNRQTEEHTMGGVYIDRRGRVDFITCVPP